MPTLHAASFTVIVLSRIGSTATFPCYVEVRYGHYSYISSLTTPLTGIDAVASYLAIVGRDLDANFIEAAVAAGVKRLISTHDTIDICAREE